MRVMPVFCFLRKIGEWSGVVLYPELYVESVGLKFCCLHNCFSPFLFIL